MPVVSEDRIKNMEFYVKTEADVDFEGDNNPAAVRGATCLGVLIL